MNSQRSDASLIAMFKFVFGKVLNKPWLLFLNVLALTIITILQFVMPQIEQFIIDKVIPNQNFQSLLIVIGLLILTAIVLGIFNYVSTYFMSIMSQNAITDLRNQLYQHLLKMDTRFFESSKTGDLMTRLTSDINNLQSLISANMLSIVGNMFTLIGVLALIFYINWQMALAVSLTFPLMFIVYRVFRKRIRNAFHRARYSQALMSNQMQQTLTEIDLIKSFTNEELEAKRFDQLAQNNRKDLIDAGRNQAIFNPLIDGINYTGVAIILLLGAYFIIKGHLTIGALVAYISYVAMVQSPIQSFTRLLNQLQQALVSYGRIKTILDETPKVINCKHPCQFPKIKNGIKIEHVSFTYQANDQQKQSRPIIDDVSIMVPYGKTTAIVGASGSGKTTLTRLIDRFYDLDRGNIYFDNVPIAEIDLKSLRSNIAIVSQDIFIIDGSIKDNVLYGRENATDEEIWQVLQLADLATFVQQLPNDINTQVGERGVKLSGGQKQRISIARALLKDAPIIILDEATASLDNESEKAIQHALDNLLKSKTSIVIAHRLSTIHNADQIIVMSNGKVVERGTHDSLMKQNGQYAELYNAQFE